MAIRRKEAMQRQRWHDNQEGFAHEENMGDQGRDRQGRRLGCNVFVIDHRNSLGRLGIARVGWGAWIQTVCNLLKNVERLRGHASATKGS